MICNTVWLRTLRKLNNAVAKLTLISTVTSCITILTMQLTMNYCNYQIKLFSEENPKSNILNFVNLKSER